MDQDQEYFASVDGQAQPLDVACVKAPKAIKEVKADAKSLNKFELMLASLLLGPSLLLGHKPSMSDTRTTQVHNSNSHQ